MKYRHIHIEHHREILMTLLEDTEEYLEINKYNAYYRAFENHAFYHFKINESEIKIIDEIVETLKLKVENIRGYDLNLENLYKAWYHLREVIYNISEYNDYLSYLFLY